MAKSAFKGFTIKGIDGTLLPPKAQREPRTIGPNYPGTNIAPAEYPRYKVFICLDPIRDSDDTSPFNIDSDIVERWLRHFNNGAGQLEYYHLKEVQQRNLGNPVTWIPYRLAEDAFVTLTIYDAVGQVVRMIEVGHQIASAYENRSKAIYWNGRNESGESVASGMYFYAISSFGIRKL